MSNALAAGLLARCGAIRDLQIRVEKAGISEQYKSVLASTKLKALAAVAFYLFRPFTPFVFAVIHLLLSFRAKPRRSRWWKALRFANASAFAANILAILHDPVIWRRYKAKAGIFLCSGWTGTAGRMARIMRHCSAMDEYKCPSALCTGDLATIIPTVTYAAQTKLELQRIYIQCRNTDSEHYGLDISCPADWTAASKIVCFVAGIGGGPDSPYIVEPATHFLSKGWAVVILIPRGMLDSQVRRVENLFDAADLSDVHGMFESLAHAYPATPILAIGSSLGGMTLCNYLGRMADSVSPNLKAVLALSGTFSSGYTEWWRYQAVFQPLIVPDLLEDILGKYESALERALVRGVHADAGSSDSDAPDRDCQTDRVGTGNELTPEENELTPEERAEARRVLSEICRCSTYVQLHEQLMQRLGRPGWQEWIARTEGAAHLHKIRVPLLVITALDDPLVVAEAGLICVPHYCYGAHASATIDSQHSPDQIGLELGLQIIKDGDEQEGAQTSAAGTSSQEEGPPVAFWITERGGHVAWPEQETWLKQAKFSFVTRLADRYFEACANEK